MSRANPGALRGDGDVSDSWQLSVAGLTEVKGATGIPGDASACLGRSVLTEDGFRHIVVVAVRLALLESMGCVRVVKLCRRYVVASA